MDTEDDAELEGGVKSIVSPNLGTREMIVVAEGVPYA